MPLRAQWRETVKSLHCAPLLLIKTPFSPSLPISLLIFLPIISLLLLLFFLNFLLIQKIFSLLLIFLHVTVISSSLLTRVRSPPKDRRSSPVISTLWFLPKSVFISGALLMGMSTSLTLQAGSLCLSPLQLAWPSALLSFLQQLPLMQQA